MTHKTQHTAGGGTSAGTRGWIKLHRSLLSWEWYSNINVTRLFIHLLLKAGRETTRWQGHELPRGSFVTSWMQLSKETGLSRQEVRTCLERLTTTGELKIVATRQFSIIILCNYDSYQAPEQTEQPTVNPSLNPHANPQSTQTSTRFATRITTNTSDDCNDNAPTINPPNTSMSTQNSTQQSTTIQEYNKKEERKKNNNNLSHTHACEERNLNFDLNFF